MLVGTDGEVRVEVTMVVGGGFWLSLPLHVNYDQVRENYPDVAGRCMDVPLTGRE